MKKYFMLVLLLNQFIHAGFLSDLETLIEEKPRNFVDSSYIFKINTSVVQLHQQLVAIAQNPDTFDIKTELYEKSLIPGFETLINLTRTTTGMQLNRSDFSWELDSDKVGCFCQDLYNLHAIVIDKLSSLCEQQSTDLKQDCPVSLKLLPKAFSHAQDRHNPLGANTSLKPADIEEDQQNLFREREINFLQQDCNQLSWTHQRLTTYLEERSKNFSDFEFNEARKFPEVYFFKEALGDSKEEDQFTTYLFSKERDCQLLTLEQNLRTLYFDLKAYFQQSTIELHELRSLASQGVRTISSPGICIEDLENIPETPDLIDPVDFESQDIKNTDTLPTRSTSLSPSYFPESMDQALAFADKTTVFTQEDKALN